MSSRLGVPDLGVGVGLRVPHYKDVLDHHPPMDFFELISENFMVRGGKPLYHLDRAREGYPLILHGVSLGIGSPEPPDEAYLAELKRLVRRVQPAWVSDHFCWSRGASAHLHDLLPLPFSEACIRRVAERARRIQDFLEVPFALENTSSYLTFQASEMTEWQFISEVTERADIGLLFDVNNVYVSAYNHGFDAYDFVRGVPHERILQIHLAGHTNMGKYVIDTHNGEVIEPVWELFEATTALTGPISTLIEWDDEIPPFEDLCALAAVARRRRSAALATRSTWCDEVASRSLIPVPHASAETTGAWFQGGPRETAEHEGGAAL